jgi:uncharacterized hydrophobic protein (TIGR00271 family)
LELSTEEKNSCRVNVADMSRPKRSYYVLAVLSTVIAAYGLLSDSTAVVIGAMLVAPLMGPIFGIAMGLITSSRKLLLSSLVAEFSGVVVVVALAFLVAKVSPMAELPGEVLARTRPNLFDIFIAFASGLAGAFALVNKKINAALPGVAIATALVPPLASSGICWAVGEMALGWGAFLLFLVNLLAIELAAAGVFTLYGLNAKRSGEGFRGFLNQFGWSLGLLVVMGFFLTRSLVEQFERASLTQALRSNLSELGPKFIQGASLQGVPEHNSKSGRVQVFVQYLTPRAFEESVVEGMEASLREKVNPNIDLVVRSLISTDRSPDGRVFETSEQSAQKQESARRENLYAGVTSVIRDYLSQVPGADLEEVEIPMEANGRDLLAVVSSPKALPPEDIRAMQKAIQEKMMFPYQLKVRSLITVEANEEGFLYQPREDEAPAVSAELRETYARIQRTVARRIAASQEGAELIALQLNEVAGRLNARATVRTPVVISPALVAPIEADLRQFVDPTVRLTISSSIEADATADGYILGSGGQ